MTKLKLGTGTLAAFVIFAVGASVIGARVPGKDDPIVLVGAKWNKYQHVDIRVTVNGKRIRVRWEQHVNVWQRTIPYERSGVLRLVVEPLKQEPLPRLDCVIQITNRKHLESKVRNEVRSCELTTVM